VLWFVCHRQVQRRHISEDNRAIFISEQHLGHLPQLVASWLVGSPTQAREARIHTSLNSSRWSLQHA
jgi:hypothetical protein